MTFPKAHSARGPARYVLALSRLLDKLAQGLAGVALSVLVGAVMLQVVARYAFQSPPPWTEELARYAMIWAGLIGATMSFKRRFDPALFKGVRTGGILSFASMLVQSAVVLIYLLPILWFCFFGPRMNPERSFLTRSSRSMAEVLDISILWVAIAVPVMIVIVLVHLVARWFGDRPVADGMSDTAPRHSKKAETAQ